jgi:hypothetical protein
VTTFGIGTKTFAQWMSHERSGSPVKTPANPRKWEEIYNYDESRGRPHMRNYDGGFIWLNNNQEYH